MASQQLRKQNAPSIGEVAQVIWLLVSSLPAVQYGTLFYRSIEIDKNMALQQHKGNYKANMAVSLRSISDLHWWVTNLPTAFKAITIDCPTIDATTDASKLGWWGAV